MKTLTIIPGENRVNIDGASRSVDCSMVDPKVHVIQWNDEKALGHIEFVDEDPNDGQCDPNETITSIEPYQALIDGWHAAKAAEEAAVAEKIAALTARHGGGANVVA